jgi:hypothetical protein
VGNVGQDFPNLVILFQGVEYGVQDFPNLLLIYQVVKCGGQDFLNPVS